MNMYHVKTALGVISFLIGFGIISFIAWLLLIANNPETPIKTINNSGAVMIVGLALIAIGTIVIAMSKPKNN